ncbi:hypothetical protein QJS83_15420 [Bdellovibrio sp. 22V]|uniref:hypothetical protein n=1 Tax=Bdellovibrio TaxID=958 RepID=UPI002543553D|nr:hypothetical protein [Bdellovibrio sp. 22V]WII71853.1 hypothetical protein QJS83_15420 [Bdellovibrio sp. 22V]
MNTVISLRELFLIEEKAKKNIAILIPQWRGENVHVWSLRTNLRRIMYEKYTIFLSVNPLDSKAKMEAENLQDLFPQRVVVLSGQTYKEMLIQVMHYEISRKVHFDLFFEKSAAHVLHPFVLTLLNHYSEEFETLQVPAFSSEISLAFSDHQELRQEIQKSRVATLLTRKRLQPLMYGDSAIKPDPRRPTLCVQVERAAGKREFIAIRDHLAPRNRRFLSFLNRKQLGKKILVIFSASVIPKILGYRILKSHL